jgi:hypothetical protein
MDRTHMPLRRPYSPGVFRRWRLLDRGYDTGIEG